MVEGADSSFIPPRRPFGSTCPTHELENTWPIWRNALNHQYHF